VLSFLSIVSCDLTRAFSYFLSSLSIAHLLESQSISALLLKLNLTLDTSIRTLLPLTCSLQLLLYLIALTYCFSSSRFAQLARGPEDSTTVVLLTLLEIKSFALTSVLLSMRESFSQSLILIAPQLVLNGEMVNARAQLSSLILMAFVNFSSNQSIELSPITIR
jgi:hypothetical protein